MKSKSLEQIINELNSKRSELLVQLNIARDNNLPHKRIENQLDNIESKIEVYSEKLDRQNFSAD